MSTENLKNILLYSLVLGLGLGVIGLIPFLGVFSAIALFILAGGAVLIFLKMRDGFQVNTFQESLVLGAISGTIALIGFSLTFLIIALVLNLFFDIENLIWISSLFSQGIFVPILMVFFVAILSAMTNAFSALVTFWAISLLQKSD